MDAHPAIAGHYPDGAAGLDAGKLTLISDEHDDTGAVIREYFWPDGRPLAVVGM